MQNPMRKKETSTRYSAAITAPRPANIVIPAAKKGPKPISPARLPALFGLEVDVDVLDAEEVFEPEFDGLEDDAPDLFDPVTLALEALPVADAAGAVADAAAKRSAEVYVTQLEVLGIVGCQGRVPIAPSLGGSAYD